MIEKHEYNSKWSNSNAGIIRSADFFEQDLNCQISDLKKFDWVEFKCGSTMRHKAATFRKLGFYLADTQLKLHLNLASMPCEADERLIVSDCADLDLLLNIEDVKEFKSERFNQLSVPGICVTSRYVDWANMLIRKTPETALQISRSGKVEGWFIGEPKAGILDLTLAMMHSESTIPGSLLYKNSLIEFGRRGYKRSSGWFSSSNIPVINIFSALGATYSAAQDIWFWENNLEEN